MSEGQFSNSTGMRAVLAALFAVGLLISSMRIYAQEDELSKKVRIGFEIAPVNLNLAGKDTTLVGLGSYIVNGENDCNACHTSGGPPNFEYLPGSNPYFRNQHKVVNPATYLGGGQDFGPVGPPPSPDIVSRNLTPDKTGRPEGGHTFAEFRQILRTGKDFDHLHPNCTATITTKCIPPSSGVNGDVLQIMPWPYYQSMTDFDLLAIYTYLSAIPCLDTKIKGQPQLRNNCY
jgi:hypothetical protein